MSENRQEEEYFARLDREKTEALRAKMDTEKAVTAAAELKALHMNHCGKCGNLMETHAYRGVEIEVCPQCGAVLLDRGELETLAGEDGTGTFRSLFSMFSGGARS